MSRFFRNAIRAGAIAAAALAAPAAFAQADPDMDAMMQAMAAAGAPGEQHEFLQRFVGSWDVEAKFTMSPGEDPTVNHGKSVVTSILGGRFTHEVFTGEFDFGGPTPEHFEGLGFNGFDNLSGKFTYCWMDNFTTGIMTGEGTLDSTGKVMTFTSKNHPDPISGGYKEVMSKVKIVSNDKHVAEFFDKGPDGEWFRSMELTYTRTR